jgi:hypothetical protein
LESKQQQQKEEEQAGGNVRRQARAAKGEELGRSGAGQAERESIANNKALTAKIQSTGVCHIHAFLCILIDG